MATLECFKQFVNEVNDVDHDFRIVFVPEPQNCTRQVKSCLPEHYDFQLSVASNWRFFGNFVKNSKLLRSRENTVVLVWQTPTKSD